MAYLYSKNLDMSIMLNLLFKSNVSYLITSIFLSVLGTGLYNYKDDTLETLSKNGNGNYFVVNDIEDVQENIYNKLVSNVCNELL